MPEVMAENTSGFACFSETVKHGCGEIHVIVRCDNCKLTERDVVELKAVAEKAADAVRELKKDAATE